VGDLLIPAIGLMLLLEGVLPLTAPRLWREVFRQMLELKDGQIRFAIGAVILMVFKK
jgi:uncharacterized protein YjeT (DUF2065 family)